MNVINALTAAAASGACPVCREPVTSTHGIEVDHVSRASRMVVHHRVEHSEDCNLRDVLTTAAMAARPQYPYGGYR